jgi:4-oxalocrotonate tautomerase
MPYLNVRIAKQGSVDIAEQIVAILMKHTSEVLGKKPDVTSIDINFVSPSLWYVGGEALATKNEITFYLDIKVTDGTNTKQEKAEYIQKVFADFESLLGRITPASYIVIHDVSADSWGFEGKTQEYRFIQSQPL